MFYSMRYGARVTDTQYWGPQPDATLEWTLSNPPPEHTFETLPTPEMWDHRKSH
jgi:cytochrome c oxidase subunit 1